MIRKASLGLLLAGMLVGPVSADPIFVDVSASPTQAPGNLGTPADPDTLSTVFSQLAVFADTTTIQYNTNGDPFSFVGDRFIDSGQAAVTDLLPPFGDDEGIGNTSEITIDWTDLSGVITSELVPTGPDRFTQTLKYDPDNTTMSFYFHGDPGSPNADFGVAPGVADNSGFTEGDLILELKVLGGDGTNTFDGAGNFISGSSFLLGEVTYALNDFWFFDNGDGIANPANDYPFTDFIGLELPMIIHADIDQNTDEVITDFSNSGAPGPLGFGPELFRVHSTHDGSVDFSRVRIPVPPTALLFMMGLMVMPILRRRTK